MWAILFTIVIMYVVITLFGYVVHRWFHHPSSGRFYKSHQVHHFKLYPPEDFFAPVYRSPGKDNTAVFFFLLSLPLILTPFILFAFHLIPLPILITTIICMAVFGGAHDFLHDKFHITDHWLNKFRWFRELVRLHQIHHREVQKNLGIYWFGWDKLLGSFRKK